MDSVLALSAVDHELSSGLVKPKTIKLIFSASLLSTQYLGIGAKTSCLGIRIMCLSGMTCLTMDCLFQ